MGCDEIVIMIMSGPDDGREIRLCRAEGHGHIGADGMWSLLLGRRDDCDISIPFDTQISRRHAMLRVSPDGRLWLSDAGSLNGTFIGTERVVEPTPLRCGQFFRLGRTWFRVQSIEGEGT